MHEMRDSKESWHGWHGMAWHGVYFPHASTREDRSTTRKSRRSRSDELRRRGVDRDVVVTMRARGTTDSGGGDGGGFSSKIMGLKVRARRAKEGWGEREREGMFLSRA